MAWLSGFNATVTWFCAFLGVLPLILSFDLLATRRARKRGQDPRSSHRTPERPHANPLSASTCPAEPIQLAAKMPDDHRMQPPRAIGRRAAIGVTVVALTRSSLAAAGGPFRVAIPTFTMTRSTAQFVAFETALRNAGWRDNLVIDLVDVPGGAEGYPAAIRDIVRQGADVIVSGGSEAGVRAARDATRSIPIVVVAFDYDPVAKGYVGGLGRPGNITGVNVRAVELAAKRGNRCWRQRRARVASSY